MPFTLTLKKEAVGSSNLHFVDIESAHPNGPTSVTFGVIKVMGLHCRHADLLIVIYRLTQVRIVKRGVAASLETPGNKRPTENPRPLLSIDIQSEQ
jgi:hypothetical protein